MRGTLEIYCVEHPRYQAKTEKKGKRRCETCQLLYILRWQHEAPDEHLGGTNPYQFLAGHLDDICAQLRVRPI